MKTAFVTGIKFFEWEGEIYATTFSREVIAARYLPVFPDLTVFAGGFPGDAQTPRTMLRASGNGVNFRLVRDLRGPADYWRKRGQLQAELEDFLAPMDGAIIRLPSPLGRLACDICRKQRKPYLVECVGCPWDSLWNHSWTGKLLAPATFLHTRKCIRAASHVVYTSKEFLQRRYPARGPCTHCSNAVLEAFDDSILERRRRKIQARTGPVVIGSCGQIDVPFKGYRYVVAAMAVLNKNGHDFRYELVGAGNPDSILAVARRHGVMDRVRVLGKKRREDVFRWLDEIDIYAQPSLTEGSPRALVEAMSRAVPSLGSAVGGIPEFLPPDCLFRNKNAESLAETLEYVTGHQWEIAQDVYARSKEYAAVLVEARRRALFNQYKSRVETGKPESPG